MHGLIDETPILVLYGARAERKDQALQYFVAMEILIWLFCLLTVMVWHSLLSGTLRCQHKRETF